MKNILLVNWGTRDKEYPFQAAKKKKLDIYLATSENYPAWVEKYVPRQRMIITNTYDSEKLLIDVLAFMNRMEIEFDAVTTFFEMNMVQTADLASALGKIFISPRAVRKSSGNKLLMRMTCRRKRIVTPKFAVFNNPEEGYKAFRQIGAPAIIKPVKSGHSFGAIYLDRLDKKLFMDCWQRARQELDSNADEWMQYFGAYKEDFLIEEYLDGEVVSVDGLVQNGQVMICGVASFIMSQLPRLVQEGTYIPAKVTPIIETRIKVEAKRIIKALEFDNCGFHCEMKLTKGQKPVLLEIAARPPGGNMLEGYQDAYGIDFADSYLDIFLGNKVKINEVKPRKYVVQRIAFPMEGEWIKNVSGVDQVSRLKGLRRFTYFKPGTLINLKVNPSDGLINFYLAGDSREDLAGKEKMIMSNLKFSFYPKTLFRLRSYLRKLKKGLR